MAANLQFDVSALDKASSTFVKVAAVMDRLSKKLDEVDGKKVDVTVGVDTKKADAQIGSFAADTQRKLAAAFKSLPSVQITGDSSDLNHELLEVREQLQSLSGKRVGIDIDATAAMGEVARLKAQLEGIRDTSADVQVRADAAAAIAQLEAVQKSAGELDGKDVKVDVKVDDKGTAAKAASEMSNVQKYALLAAAAAPLVGGGFAALPAILAAAVIPAAAVATGVQGITEAATALDPQLRSLQSSVSAVFVTGLAPAVANVSKLMPGLQTGLSGTANALSTVATRVTGVVSSAQGLQQLQTIFAGVNRVVSSLAPSMATLTSNSMALAQGAVAGLQPLGQILQEVGQRWSEVIARMNASGTTQAAVSGLVQVLGGLLNVLPPLVEAGMRLMAVVGPPLASALNAVASVLGFLAGPLGSVTTAVIAMAAAWKVASLAVTAATSGWGKLAGLFTATSAASTAAASGVRQVGTAAAYSGGAVTTAASSTSKFGNAMSKIGTAVPIVGAALIGFGIAAETASENQDRLYNALLEGKSASEQLTASVTLAATSASSLGTSYSDVSDKVKAAEKAMTPLQLAQNELTKAQNAYNAAVKGTDPAATAAAQVRLAAATQAVAKAQTDAAIASANLGVSFQTAAAHFTAGAAATDRAQQSTLLLADAYSNLADPLQTASQKAESFSAAFRAASDPATQLAVATQAVNDSMRELKDTAEPANTKLINLNGTINTTTEAGSQLQTAFLGTAQAIQDSFGATVAAEAATKGVAAASADAALAFANQKQSLVDLLVSQGASRAAAQALVDTYVATPPALTTTISQPGMVEAIANAAGLKSSIVGIPNDKSVIVKSISADARADLESLGLKVTTLPNGQILITADSSQARNEALMTVTFTNGQTGIMTIDGNPSFANNKITQAVVFADGSKGTITIDGNQTPANGKVDGVVTYADGRTGTVKVDANTSAAQGKVDSLISSNNGRTIQIYVSATGTGGIASAGRLATGGIVEARRFASSGMHNPQMWADGRRRKLRPASSSRSMIAGANTWRVFGDIPNVREYYLRDDDSSHTMAIGADWARRRGLGLVPLDGTPAAAAPAGHRPSGPGWRPPIHPAYSGGTGAAGSATVRAEIQGLRTDLRRFGLGLADAIRSGTGFEATAAQASVGLLDEVRRRRPSAASDAQDSRTLGSLGGW